MARTIVSRQHTRDLHLADRLPLHLLDWRDCEGRRIVALRPVLRSTMQKDWFVCRRLFLLRHRLGLQPATPSYAAAASVGSLFHEGHATLYAGHSAAAAAHRINDIADKAEAAIREAAGRTGILPGGVIADDLIKKLRKDQGISLAMVLHSWDIHPLDPNEYKALHIELAAEVRLKALRTPIGTRTDLILEHIPTGELWIVDHKTTSRQTPLEKSATLGYAFQRRVQRLVMSAKHKALDGRIPIGTLHQIIQVPTIRQKQTETLPDFHDRVAAWYKENPERYLHSWSRFSGPPLDEETAYTLTELDWAVRAHLLLSRFPRTGEMTVDCKPYNRPCPYARLCQHARATWKQTLSTDYRVAPRDEESPDEERNNIL